MSGKKPVDYASLQAELEEIISELQAGDLSIDEAMRRHEAAQKIIKQLESLLEEAENKISKVSTESGS